MIAGRDDQDGFPAAENMLSRAYLHFKTLAKPRRRQADIRFWCCARHVHVANDGGGNFISAASRAETSRAALSDGLVSGFCRLWTPLQRFAPLRPPLIVAEGSKVGQNHETRWAAISEVR